MAKEIYEIYEFRYIDKKTKIGCCVYARTEAKAQEIIDIENEQSVLHFVKPKLIKFKRKLFSETPPYELEQEQLEVVQKRREKRYKYIQDHGGFN